MHFVTGNICYALKHELLQLVSLISLLLVLKIEYPSKLQGMSEFGVINHNSAAKYKSSP